MYASSNVGKLSSQRAPGFQPTARKAGQDHDEDRDTIHPGMLTDFPLHVIAALGKTVSVHRINKYTREEALWSRCFRLWRRSPIWLLVRVTLQLHFTRQGPIPSATDALYEIFMIQLLFLLLSYARSYLQTSGDGHIYVTNAKMLRRLRKAETLSQLSDVKPSWIDSSEHV